MIVRKKPIAKKRAKKRTWKSPRCQVRRCGKKAEVLWFDFHDNIETDHALFNGDYSALDRAMCKSHAKAEADRRFSLFIRNRDGKCQRCGKTEGLQCAHVVSRRYLSVRWNERNARALCVGCHKWETEQPLASEAWWETVSPGTRFILRTIALTQKPMDLASVLSVYPA